MRLICYDAAMQLTHPRWLLWSALAIVAALALYVASSGPVFWILHFFSAPDACYVAADVFYWPLIVVGKRVPAVKAALDWYVVVGYGN